MVRVFLLIVDRDGQPGRRQQLERLEGQAGAVLLETNRVFLAENAWQEVEVWVLAGLEDLPKAWSWADIRADADREVLAREAAGNYDRIRQLCPEDVASLEERIRRALDT